MARIFLSYAREDAAKAKSLATALERAGHSVWWDSHLGGGARFEAEIAAELRDCEVVVVLWSRHSISSTWVQDEAAEGRDNAKLVPIITDGIRPPLGFRQFQAVNLSRWGGRGRVPQLAAIEAAISTVLKGGTLARPSEASKPRRKLLGGATAKMIGGLITLLLLTVAAILYGTGRLSPRTEVASLAVMPFADFSPQRDKAYFAEGVAEEIRTLLSAVPGVRVTGRISTELLGPTADFREARSKLGVTHLLEGSMRVQGSRMRLHVRLIRTKDGIQVWAEQFDRELKDIFQVQSEVGDAVAGKLRARLWLYPLAERPARTKFEVYDLVLASRSKMGEETYAAALEAHDLAKRAATIDPKYAPAWLELSRSIHAINQSKPEGPWGSAWPALSALALRYAQHAVSLDPNSADAQAFLGWSEADQEQPELALPRIEKAMKLNPGESAVWGIAGLIYKQLCDPRRQLDAFRRYIELEPLNPLREDFILGLYALDHTAEADEWRRKIAQTELAEAVASDLAFQKGDFSAALVRRLKANPNGPGLRAAFMFNTLGRTDRAVQWLPSDYHNSLGAYWLGDFPSVASQTAFIGTAPWNNSRTLAVERALAYTSRHDQLLHIFDRRFRSIEDFDRRLRCNLPSHAAPIVLSLQRAGRTRDASRLAELAERRYRQSFRTTASIPSDHAGFVQLLIVLGRHTEALDALERAQRTTGSWDEGPALLWLNLADPIYDPIRKHPRFKAVEQRIASWRSKELHELSQAGVRI